MQCQELTGFLMLRRCETTAMFRCSYCGIHLCGEHATPVVGKESLTPPSTEHESDDALPVPPTLGQTVACQKCLRQQQAQQTGAVYEEDDYYRYPYHGSYRPYLFGSYFDDRDRSVFDRERVTQPDVDEIDALGS